MNFRKRPAIGVWVGLAMLGLATIANLATAFAQERAGVRHSKVSSVEQASYEDGMDEAPRLLQPAAQPAARFANRQATYQRYGQGGIAQRSGQSQFQRPRGGRSQAFVAQRQTPAAASNSDMLLPAPDSQMAAGHPMDDPFDESQGSGGADWHGPMVGPGYGPGAGPMDHFDGGPCNGGDCGGGACQGGDCNGCSQCSCLIGPWLWENFSVFGGVQGFKGPPDLGINGNFGFHEGVNWAFPIFDQCGIGMQIGAQAVHSDLSGTTTSSDNRKQFFGTIGLFHRPICGTGLQYGIAYDHLNDEFGEINVDLDQVRAEVSLIGCSGNEIGFSAAMGTADDTHQQPVGSTLPNDREREVTDQYAIFFRRHFCNGSWARFSGGFTDNSEGLLGADFEAPLTAGLTLASNFNYRIPNESTDLADARQESWALAINLVWYPCRRQACGAGPSPYRPLFNVADNATFFVDQTR